MTRALDAALLARASRVFPARELADELDVARALADDADDELADDEFAAAHALYDRALKTLASGDAQDSHHASRVEKLRVRCFLGASRARLGEGDADAALALAHRAYGEAVFDADATTTRATLEANARAQLALGNVDAAVLCCLDALKRGCEDVSGFPDVVAEAARDARDAAPTDAPALDKFVTLTMRLNRTEEDLSRIEGALDVLDRAHTIDARDACGNNVLWGALMGARRVAAEEDVDAAEDTVGAVRLVLERGARANQRYERGTTPLHLAVTSGVVGAVETVLEFGGRVDARDDDGKTPLMTACGRAETSSSDKTTSSSRVVDALLAAGANAELRDATGMTALHSACKFGNCAAVESLLRGGANWRARTPTGESPIMLAYAHARQSGVVGEILTHAERVPDGDDDDGESAWFLATHAEAERETTTAATRRVREDLRLIKFCEREKAMTRAIAETTGVNRRDARALESLSARARQDIAQSYMDLCGFELEDGRADDDVAKAAYERYGDVLEAFKTYLESTLPKSLVCFIKEDQLTGSCVSDDDVHRLVYAKNAVGATTACESFDVGDRVALASPVVIDLERTLDASVRRAFAHGQPLCDAARPWLLAEGSFVAASRGGAYAANRLRDALGADVAAFSVPTSSSTDAPPTTCFIDDATIVAEDDFTAKTLETRAASTLFVELAPGDDALLRLAVDAYSGDTVVTVSRVADVDTITDVMCSNGFVEDVPKRATTRDAVSAFPVLTAFARWTRARPASPLDTSPRPH